MILYRVYHETTDPERKEMTKWYIVKYTLDETKESLRQYSNVVAYVQIWADNGKVFKAAFLGPGGGGLYNLDENPNQKADFKIKLSKPAKLITRDTSYYDKNGKLVQKRAYITTYDY